MDFEEIIDAPNQAPHEKKSNTLFLMRFELAFFLFILIAVHNRFLIPYDLKIIASIAWYFGFTALILFNSIYPFIKTPRQNIHWFYSICYGLGGCLIYIGLLLKINYKIYANESLLIGLLMILIAHFILIFETFFCRAYNSGAKLFFGLIFITFLCFIFGTMAKIMSWPGANDTYLYSTVFAVFSLVLLNFNNKDQQQLLMPYIPRLIAIALMTGLSLI